MKPLILKIAPSQIEKEKIKKALEILRKGGVICFPTDTVYGLGVDAKNEIAVQKLYNLKKRPRKKPLILFLNKSTKIAKFVKKIPLHSLKLISSFWPGPLTVIFEAILKEPFSLVTEEGKIGIRVPSHPVAQQISEEEDIIFATTSANISTKPSAKTAEEIPFEIKREVDLIIDSGKTPLGVESTVVDVTTYLPSVLREGVIKEDRLRKTLEDKVNILFVCTANMCRSVMAEAIFKKIWNDKKNQKIEVKSAGTSALSSYSPTSYTIKVMKERGLDVSSHLSRPLTKNLVEEADIIFTMEKTHKYHIRNIYPFAQNKIWLLKEFSSGREEEIQDPVGLSEEHYRKTAREIEEEIKKVVEKIDGKQEGQKTLLG